MAGPREAVHGMRGRRLSRRSLLAASGLGLLTACTTSTTQSAPSATPSVDTTSAEGPIRWANWPDYIDVDGKGNRHPTLEEFTAESGIQVAYDEVIQDNDEYVDSIVDRLAEGQDVGADLPTLTSWKAAELAGAGQLRPFGPTTRAGDVIRALATPAWDRAQAMSMPWQAGLTGIAYDARKVDRAIGSIDELFTRDDLKGKVGLLGEFDDTLGMLILASGRDVAVAGTNDVEAAIERLKFLVSSGRVSGFFGNEYLKGLTSGSLVASLAWSGDIQQARQENPYLKFVFPEEGMMIWADNLVVPRGSAQAPAVARLADYYYQPEVAARVAASVNYICPVVGAQAAMEDVDANLVNDPLIFPDDAVLDRAFQFPNLPRNWSGHAGIQACPSARVTSASKEVWPCLVAVER